MKYVPNEKNILLNFRDPAVIAEFNDAVSNMRPYPGIPANVAIGDVFNDSIEQYIDYTTDALTPNDELNKIINSLEPASKVLRTPYVKLDDPEVRERIKASIVTGEPLDGLHPQIPLSEAMVFSMIHGLNKHDINYEPLIPQILPLLKHAANNEGFTTNTPIYSTRQNEFYWKYDPVNTYAESLYFHAPEILDAGIGDYVIDLIKNEPARKHPFERWDMEGSPIQDSFDMVPYSIISGNFKFAIEALKQNANPGRDEFVCEHLNVAVFALLKSYEDAEKRNAKDELDLINDKFADLHTLAKMGYVNMETMVIKPNYDKDESKKDNPDYWPLKDHLFAECKPAYDAITSGLLNKKAADLAEKMAGNIDSLSPAPVAAKKRIL